LADGNNNLLQIKVTRDTTGNWKFWVDKTGNGLYIPQGSVYDNTYYSAKWFGLYCNYTASNSDAFYFDDVYVGDIITDTKELKVNYTVAVNSTTLDIYFNKVVDENSAQITANYWVDGIGSPVIADRPEKKPYRVRLLFGEEFEQKTPYNINISNVSDYLKQFTIDDYKGIFHLYYPDRFDVVFNELMVNPTPTVELSPYRYIELYNTTNYYINTGGWSFISGNDNPVILPDGIIPPQGYLVLVREGDLPYFSNYENVMIFDPGYHYLTSGGRTISLRDANGDIMHSVDYTDEWYKDPSKMQGGWSLEQIDPYNPCGGKGNWSASIDPKGGTPGKLNSIDDDNPDDNKPYLLRCGFIDPFNIVLVFSEPMDETTLLSTGNYQINKGIGNPTNVSPVEPDFRKVKLLLPEKLKEGQIYRVEVTDDLTDCVGNKINMEKNITRVAVPHDAGLNDVVINEILFNPPQESSQRYIEIYNRSDKVIDLSNYYIASKDTVENKLEYDVDDHRIAKESYLFFPRDYIVLTTNPGGVKKHYMTTNPDGFIRIGRMPRMTNDGGVAVFAHKSQKIIDMVVYSDDMHYPLLHDKSGVALERRNYDMPSCNESNWHSAAQNVGFGTPGFRNSQFTRHPNVIEDDITVKPDIFSPNNDGHNDVLNIYFKFEKPGYSANINIYDARGRRIKTLERGKLLATDDLIIWDGTNDNNQKADIGIYVIFIELYDPFGNVRQYKKSAVLAGRLN